MRTSKLWALTLCLLGSTQVFAAEPTEQSIRQLLEITQAKALVQSAHSQMDGMFQDLAKQALDGKPATPERSAIIDKAGKKMADVAAAEMSWQTLEPMYLRLYKKTFTQEEVDGMISFYGSPAGQAVAKKMPVLMRHVMSEMQQRQAPLMAKFQLVAEELVTELNALDKK